MDAVDAWIGLLENLAATHKERALEHALGGQVAPMENIEQVPRLYFLGAPGVSEGKLPSFGWRCEHTGSFTLREWAAAHGMDLVMGAYEHEELDEER